MRHDRVSGVDYLGTQETQVGVDYTGRGGGEGTGEGGGGGERGRGRERGDVHIGRASPD